ncbi:hypothetical protein LWI29_025722 [Acer saccharum]|uniref:Uncharacterized protein n=1 Tax=Acer saccharum TaxID=4024 RepID=A0AA39W583_ACESA|nr:hypothetical protein LWI29_025722 [Acer saccharum]
MANFPHSLPLNTLSGGVPSPANPKAAVATAAGAAGEAVVNKDRKMTLAEQLVLDLSNPELIENALLELSKEIVSIYPVLSSPNLTTAQSNRVCNAFSLFQCVASHPDTKMPFLNAQIPLYLYPFLKTTRKSRPYEYLRLTSLGVIGTLVKVDDKQVISFLLSTDIIPPCLVAMEMGSELSKTVATFIVQKILLDDEGLDYIYCQTMQGHVMHCVASFQTLLRDDTFSSCLCEGPTTRCWLQQLLYNVRVPELQAGAGFNHMQVN